MIGGLGAAKVTKDPRYTAALMRSRTTAAICVIACATLTIGLAAQEGHPLTGTWSGDWGATAENRTRITLVMTWDGKAITGTINPGPEAMTLGRVTVDYGKWTVRIEADGKDSSGKPVRVLADGKLDDLGSWHRTLNGTWIRAGAKGSFTLRRD
jgi:hypothetical protein